MCLRFVFLLVARVAAGLRLSQRRDARKTAEILILRHQLAIMQRRQPRRPRLNRADRALLATLPGVTPRARRHGLRLLVTPDTILRWHRDIIRRRWAARSMHRKTGRPATRRNIQALARRLARENPGRGYRRIHGELEGPGVKVAAPAVWEILKASGIDPARRQAGPTWSQFLRPRAGAVLACDFFTADLLDGTQAYVLAVIEHASRRIRILGVTSRSGTTSPNPGNSQVAKRSLARNIVYSAPPPRPTLGRVLEVRRLSHGATIEGGETGAWQTWQGYWDRAVGRGSGSGTPT